MKLAYFSAFLWTLGYPFPCAASTDAQPPAIGNFALPASQQPGPMLGFGQNILLKNQVQIFLFADDYAGVNQHSIELIPSILYGITDNLSLFLNAPYAVSNQQGSNKSAGFEDAFAQLEYAFYNGSNTRFTDQATVVANITAPTGSISKNPNTGVGSPSFFLGTTWSRTYVDWFYFASPGATLTTAKNGTKFGNSYLYQGGFGRNIANINGWLLAWMLEGDGTYTQKTRFRGSVNPNSGGNVFYLTPSFWASTKRLLFQLGAGWAVAQSLNGSQPRNTYVLAANLGWGIN
jgi:hypothetical protein